MKALLILLLLGAVVALPFSMIKAQWAVRLWQRLRLLLVIYALVILISGIVRLIFQWDDFYG